MATPPFVSRRWMENKNQGISLYKRISLRRRNCPSFRSMTFIFKLPSDDHTAVYWRLQDIHQDDSNVLTELKNALDKNS